MPESDSAYDHHKTSAFVATAWLILVAATLFAAYQQLFSTFSQYDDEGYVMVSLRSFCAGRPLYDETFTQYGPAYYFVNAIAHRSLAWPITTEVARWKTLLIWIATSLLSGLFVFRLTKRHAFAFAAFGGVFLHLDKLPLEPGHPQELCVLALACVLVCATMRFGTQSLCGIVPAVMAGVLCGLVAMTKINVGIILTLAVFAGLTMVLRAGRVCNVLVAGNAFACLALPLGLFRDHLLVAAENRLPLLTAFAIVGLLLLWRQAAPDHNGLALRVLAYFIAALSLTIGLTAVLTLRSGTTVSGLWYGLIGQHAAFSSYFFHPPDIAHLAVPTVIGFVLLIGCSFWHRETMLPCLKLCRLLAIAVLVHCGLAYVGQSGFPPTHGLQPRGGMWMLASFAPTLMGLLLLRDTPSNNLSEKTARCVLAVTAILMPLSMFPTPGTQVAIGTLPLWLGCLLLADDSLKAWHESSTGASAAWASRIGWALAGLMVAAVISRDISYWHYRSQRMPLALPGTGGLRLAEDRVAQYQHAVQTLRERAASFVFAEHGYNSLYLWSGITPPTPLNTTFGRILLRPEQQVRIVESLKQAPGMCVVREHSAIELPRGPLVEFIDAEFEPHATIGAWQLWVRKS